MNYSDTTSALVINKLTKSQYETLKASGSLQSNQIYITPETLPSNLGDFNNDVGYVTASAVAASYATKGEVEVVTASVEALASSVSALGSQVSAMASSISAKRDYDDLTYNITTPAEALDISKFSDLWDIDATYAAKLTFTLSGSVNPITLTYDNSRWLNDNYAVPDVGFAQFYELDPSDGMFVLYDNVEGSIIQFDLEDGTNTQVFNFTSQEYPDFTTLTMTFNGDAGHTISDHLALNGEVEVVSASVSTLSSQVGANTSSIAGLASSVSAMTSNFNVSGIGCSTIVLSGTYADSTSFAYNFVIQPSA